jgi:hypothetical protein
MILEEGKKHVDRLISQNNTGLLALKKATRSGDKLAAMGLRLASDRGKSLVALRKMLNTMPEKFSLQTGELIQTLADKSNAAN